MASWIYMLDVGLTLVDHFSNRQECSPPALGMLGNGLLAHRVQPPTQGTQIV